MIIIIIIDFPPPAEAVLVIEDVVVREDAGSVMVTITNVGRPRNLNFNVMTRDISATDAATGQWMLL